LGGVQENSGGKVTKQELRDNAIKAVLHVAEPFQVQLLAIEDISYQENSMFLRISRRLNHSDDYTFVSLSTDAQITVEDYLVFRDQYRPKVNNVYVNRFGGILGMRTIYRLSKEVNRHEIVYFIADEHNRVKIGKAIDVQKRLSMIQADNADEVKLLATEPNEDGREKKLHNKFSHLHIRGEWYRGSKELMDYIEQLPSSS